ncbi:MAG TPA: DinB family protein [Candidatus Acidoferrum sp.]
MKNFARRLALLALAVPLLFSVAVRAQELTQADKEKALQLLETSKKMVLHATKDLSPTHWNFKSAPDRWSVAECVEHVCCRGFYPWHDC